MDFHCLPHRLELALLELQKSCKSVDDVYSVLHLIWKTHPYSPKSVRALKSIADELQVDILKPTQVSGTRWLLHVSLALNVFVGTAKSVSVSEPAQYSAVLMHMEDLSVNSKVADIQGRARYISSKMNDIHFAAFCHFLADLFSILSRLSLQMQRNDIILPTIVSHLKESKLRVECLTSRPAPDGHLENCLPTMKKGQSFPGVVLSGTLEGKATRGGITTSSLQSEIETAVNLCIRALNERFDVLLEATGCRPSIETSTTVYGPKEVVKDMLIFIVDVWPTRSSDLMDYGRQEIQRLTD